MQLSVWWETSQTYRVAKFKGLALVFAFMCSVLSAQAQETYTFGYTGSIVEWTVPAGVTKVKMETWGAQGKSAQSGIIGGKGAYMSGEFYITPGDKLLILVGEEGKSTFYNGGGGGGTYIVKVDPTSTNIISTGTYAGTKVTPILIAGGGGGTRIGASVNGFPGVTSEYGTTGSYSFASGNGGGITKTSGIKSGGIVGSTSWGSAGAGFVGDGQSDSPSGTGGTGFLNGSTGGIDNCNGYNGIIGGFGGGGGGGCGGGGGGGGYSGGDGGFVAGGGGSYNAGTSQDNIAGANTGNGKVVITSLYAASLTETKSIACAGDATGELTATVTGGTAPYTYSWSAGGSTTNVNSNLTAGEYTVTVNDAAGNTTTVTKTIAVNDSEKPTITGSAVTTDLIKTAAVTLPNNNAYASSSPMVINFQDPLPVGAEMTGVTLTFTVQSSYLAAVSSSISGTGTGDFHPNAETKTVTFNYNGKLPNYVYGGTNNFTLYSWWNGVRFKGGTITIHYATQNPVGCTALVTVPAPTASDNCGDVTLVNDFNGTADASGAYPVGTTDVIWTATDANGNASTYTQKVTVVDNMKPTITAPASVTVNTDPGKNTASGVVLGTPVTADNCEVGTTTSDAPATFPLGNTTVTWTVTDKAGNTATATQVVTVQDNEAPVPTIATLPDVTAECAATVTAPTATDNVDGAVTGTTADALKYTEQGTYTINWTYTDAAGNKATQQQKVIVKDITKPTVVTQNITVNLDATGKATITAAQINNGSTDNCAIAANGYSLDITSFTCANVGPNTVTLTVTDATGNAASATAIVTVKDVTAPVAKAKNITVQLDENGTATITPDMVDNGSSDNCSISSMSLSKMTFDCSNIGTNSVTLTVNDAAGNDRMIPQGLIGHWDFDGSNPKADLTGNWGDLILNSSATITSGKLNVVNGSIARTSSYAGQTINSKTLVSYVSINNLNVRSGSAMTIDRIATDEFDGIVYAENQLNKWMNGSSIARRTIDLTPGFAETVPNQLVMMAITYENVADGKVQITLYRNGVSIGSYLANNATSWSAGNAEIIFGARHFNNNTVIGGIDAKIDEAMIFNRALSASEIASLAEKANQATAIITVEDNIAPVAKTQNITIQLDATGKATITAAAVNNNSTDNCAIETYALDITSFDCSDIGANTVTLTVTDKSGYSHAATAVVTVEDKVAPVAIAQNITVQLDAEGKGSIDAILVDNGSSDACGISSLALTKTAFDCSNIGANTVTLIVTDNNGNISTAEAIITVEDKIAPVAIAQNITVQLDANGNATIVAADVNNNSTDACGIKSMVLSQTVFGCANVGENEVTLTVTDNNGNTAMATAIVTVEDKVAPVAKAQNVTIQLGANGQATVTADAVNNGSNDACGIESLVLDKTTFTCENVGANEVTLTVTDKNGNVTDVKATITVEDNIAPVAAAKGITVELDDEGKATITADQLNDNSSDNCGIKTVTLSKYSFDCSNTGAKVVTLTVTDNSGNTASVEVTVTVQDNINPNITAPADVVVDVDPGKNTASNVALGVPVTADNCAVADITNNAPAVFQTGTTTVIWTVIDASGNESTATQKVTVRRDIVAVTTPATINVPIRTTFENVPLPTQVTVTYSDDVSEEIGVTWAQGAYDGTIAGTYELTGQLSLVEGTTNTAGKTASITVVVEPNKAPTALAFSATTFAPNIKADEAIGTLSTTDPDDTQFVYTLVVGRGDLNNNLFEIIGDKVYLKSNSGLSGKTEFSFRVRSIDPYQNTIEEVFTVTKGNYGVAVDKLKIVNAFSPNGDGINDTWRIPELSFYNDVVVEVFDRSGVRLFHTTNPEMAWDGRSTNGQVLQGAFFYIVQVKDINLVKKGVVTILKK